jgi:hypothetical protein
MEDICMYVKAVWTINERYIEIELAKPIDATKEECSLISFRTEC